MFIVYGNVFSAPNAALDPVKYYTLTFTLADDASSLTLTGVITDGVTTKTITRKDDGVSHGNVIDIGGQAGYSNGMFRRN